MVRKYRKELATVVLLMVAAAFFSLSQIPPDYFISNDGCSYSKTAKNLIEGRGYTYMGEPNVVFPPAYPIMIAAFYKLTGNVEKSGIYASAFAWILSIIPLFFIVWLLYKKNYLPTLLTMLILVTSPQLNLLSRKILSEATYLLFLYISILLFVYFVIHKQSDRVAHYLLIGTGLGLAYLARPEGFVFMLLIVAAAVFFLRENIKSALRCGLLIILAFFVIAAPYIVYLAKTTGHLALSGRVGVTLTGGERIWENDYKINYEKNLYGITPDRNGVYMYRGMFFSSFGYVIKNFPAMVERFFHNLGEYAATLFRILWPVGVLLLLALFIRRNGFNKKQAIFTAFLILPVFANVLFFLIERYLYQYLVFFLMLAGVGLYNLGELIKSRLRVDGRFIITGQVVLIILMHLPIFTYYLHPYEERKIPWNEHKQLGIWMKSNIDDIEEKLIVSRKAFVPFYAGAVYKALPWVENRFELFHYLSNVKADYLVVDTRYFKDLRPKIYYLLETERKFEPLELVKIIENKKHKIVLYRFKGYY